MTSTEKSGVPLVFKIMGLLMVIVLLLVGGAISFYQNCDECQKFVGLMADGFEEIQAAMVAPGTDEMRALGCDEVMAIDMEKFVEFIEAIESDNDNFAADQPILNATMLMCQKNTFSTPDGPECDDVVQAYLSGAHPSAEAELAVIVQGESSQNQYCSGVYSGTGQYLGSIDDWESQKTSTEN